MGFDLGALDSVSAANDGAVMPVIHPADNVPLMQPDGNPVVLRLVGEDSDIARAQRLAVANNRLKQAAATRGAVVSAEQAAAENLEFIVACTTGFSGVDLDDAPLEYSRDNVRKLYKRCPWLREQAEAFVFDRANFMKASRKS